MSEINNEIFSKENNSVKNNSNKKKIEQENIEDFAEKIHNKHLKLNKEQIKKCLLIFQELIANEKESGDGDLVDGGVSIILILMQQISELLKCDIDSLFPKIVKTSHKTLKAIVGVFSTVKNDIKKTNI